MSSDLYHASAKTFTHNLKNLSAMLKAAEKNAKSRGIDEAVLMNARLAPDMLPLPAQVMIATDHAKGACARLTGQQAPTYADDDVTFEALQARIKKTLEYIRGIKAAEYEGAGDRHIELKIPIGTLEFSGNDYLFSWALPNFWFHVTTAYAILRHNGVPLGKKDFLGKPPGMEASGQIAKMMGVKPKKKKKKAKKKPARKEKKAAKRSGRKS